jgi:hypothetical protein
MVNAHKPSDGAPAAGLEFLQAVMWSLMKVSHGKK